MAKAKTATRKQMQKPAGRRHKGAIDAEQQTAAILAEVLVYFGAGYGCQRQSETASTAVSDYEPIFDKPRDLEPFFRRLFRSTLKNLTELQWTTSPGARTSATTAAFYHGIMARQRQTAEHVVTLKNPQIQETLKQAQAKYCPDHGGGRVCS